MTQTTTPLEDRTDARAGTGREPGGPAPAKRVASRTARTTGHATSGATGRVPSRPSGPETDAAPDDAYPVAQASPSQPDAVVGQPDVPAAPHVREPAIGPVGGPVSSAWREDTLTRAEELEALCRWVVPTGGVDDANAALRAGVEHHLAAARNAAAKTRLPRRLWRGGPEIQRAVGNLYAAEAELLNMVPSKYLHGQLPSILNHVQRHLPPTDARRIEVERIAQIVGVKDADHARVPTRRPSLAACEATVDDARGKIVTAARGASSAALREQLRVRSFRNVLVVAGMFMTALAIGLAIWAVNNPTAIPMCFDPETPGETVVVCAVHESREPIPADGQRTDIDDLVAMTVDRWDVAVVEIVGLSAAALAAAAALRGIRGSSESLYLPVALAVLKLPTGALTAYLGLILMRGQFIPGLSALDSSAQIIAWAAVFGYAQQLFTRLVDQQAHTVLDNVRTSDKPPLGGTVAA